MIVNTLQIFWHGKEPILCLDFHPSGLLCTGGADKDIKLWSLGKDEHGASTVTFHSSLDQQHHYAVNAVSFSPAGDLLASGADGGELLLWKFMQNERAPGVWKVVRSLSRHEKDVLDLSWSCDGTSLISGSVDNSCIIWDTARGTVLSYLTEHKHYVQGVAWDPSGTFVASLSGDRSCCIYSATNSFSKGKAKAVSHSHQCIHHISKQVLLTFNDDSHDSEKDGQKNAYNIFHDENIRSFFRRLSWSPDGSLLVVPAGLWKQSVEDPPLNVCYIFSRSDFSRPVMHVPCGGKPVVVACFCPKLFCLPRDSSNINQTSHIPGYRLPYKMVFALATLNSVFIYDTMQSQPLAILAGLHYASITDLAWSPDGKFLAASSQDGYCSLATFEEGDLGTPMTLEEIPGHIATFLPEAVRSRAATAAATGAASIKHPSSPRTVLTPSHPLDGIKTFMPADEGMPVPSASCRAFGGGKVEVGEAQNESWQHQEVGTVPMPAALFPTQAPSTRMPLRAHSDPPSAESPHTPQELFEHSPGASRQQQSPLGNEGKQSDETAPRRVDSSWSESTADENEGCHPVDDDESQRIRPVKLRRITPLQDWKPGESPPILQLSFQGRGEVKTQTPSVVSDK